MSHPTLTATRRLPQGSQDSRPRELEPHTELSALLDRELETWIARDVPPRDRAMLQALYRRALRDPARELWAWVADSASRRAYDFLQTEACRVASGTSPDRLASLLRDHVGHALDEVRERLHEALRDLRREIGDGPPVQALHTELERLERGYV